MICPLFPGGTKYAASCLDGAPNPDLARSEFGPCPDCPVDFGPWGAWRATIMQHVEAFEFFAWLEIPYGGSLQTDFKTHGDICRSCEYGLDYRGRSFCCKPMYWVGGRTHGVRDCSAYVRQGVRGSL